MKYCIKVQSVSDIITNSSSEVFTVQTQVDVDIIRDWFYNTLRIWGYSDEAISQDDSIGGWIYEREPGVVVISYGIMCNIEESIEDLLIATFGKENVEAEY